MPKDLKGIHLYAESDTKPTFSELINMLGQSVSDSLAYFAGPSAKRAALTPAPPGGMWKDTDNGGKIWSCGPTGQWRQHEGAITVNVPAFASSSPVFYATVALTIPTTLAANESIELYVIGANQAAYLTVSADTVTRGPASTEVSARLTRMAAAGAITVTFGWRVVRNA